MLWEPHAPVLQYARSVISYEPYQKKLWWMPQTVDSMRRIKVENCLAQFLELTLGVGESQPFQ